MKIIREAYWNAGRDFGWSTDDKYNGAGVGLDIRHFQALKNDTDYLEVTIKKPTFKGKIRKDKAREIFTKYSSRMTKGGVVLVVLPISEFDLSTG